MMQQSINNFKYIKKNSNNYFKGCNFNRELLFYSTALKNDLDVRLNNVNRKWYKYPRGTLVLVDFGLNIGSELSGAHYAITLSKKDNPFSDKVTVIPLTSKSGTHNKKLDFNISKELARLLATTGVEISSKDNRLEFLSLLWNNNEDEISVFFENLEKEKNERKLLKKQLDYHMKALDKKSYIKLDNVTTISKHRIRKSQHKHDPLGKVTVNKEQMNKIDQLIVDYILDN